jgi:hypothetical protein
MTGKSCTFDTGTIGGFTMSSTTLSATNFTVTSGAANTARLTIGTGSNLAGLNSGNAGTDIAFWAGDTHTNRATAPFRVNLQGDVVAESITIDGYVVETQGSFGGDGSDGALAITSGTTTISAASAMKLTKNYTSISITSTGKLAFSNPHANGTIFVLKSQGNVTITSSGSPTIDVSSMGASSDSIGTATSVSASVADSGGDPGSAGTSRGAGLSFLVPAAGGVQLACGAGGGTGGSSFFGGSGGAGGRGGGALYIECGGALDFGASATISASGANGSNGSNTNNGGGGGGGGGTVVILYNTLTTNAGTITSTGGTGGTGQAAGGAGGTGASGGGSLANGGGGGGSAHVDYGQGGGGGGGNGGSAGSAGGTSGSTAGGGGGGGGGSWLVDKNTVLA